jgi:hypothetical protein
MDLLPLFQWFEATAIATRVRESMWLFPVIQCFHLLALALLGGAILVVDLRLLGLGLSTQPVPALARQVDPWLAGSLAMMIATGVPMFLSESLKCYYSPPFWYKIGLLLLATVFAYTVRRRVAARCTQPVRRRLTGAVSMALWFGVAFSGRWIAFY